MNEQQNSEQRDAILKATRRLQSLDLADPVKLTENAVNIQAVQAMFMGTIAVQLIDLNTALGENGRVLGLIRNAISSNAA